MRHENECTVSKSRAFPAPLLVATTAGRCTADLAAKPKPYWRFFCIVEPLNEYMALAVPRQRTMAHFVYFYAINKESGAGDTMVAVNGAYLTILRHL